jgi:DNA-binding MarR family transcriptional regulator
MANFIQLTTTEEYQPASMPEIFQLIGRVEKKLKQIQRETIKETNLTPPQYVVMTLLWERDARPFKELAAAVHCTRATMTGLVDTLEKKGLVARTPNPNDRRSLLVQLTPAGALLQRTTPTLDRIFTSCCDGLTLTETRQLSRLLKKLDISLVAE